MKRTARIVPILASLVWLPLACRAESPSTQLRDSGTGLPCQNFADFLVSYTPAGASGPSPLGEQALGAPDGNGVPLATNASLYLGFVGLQNINNLPGMEFRVHGTTSDDAEVAVYVSFGQDEGEESFEYSGNLGPGFMEVDLNIAQVPQASFIRFVGIEGTASIDAVESLQTRCP